MFDHVSPDIHTVVLVGGGIGAGKSSVLRIFEEHGFLVISTDEIGRDVLADGSLAAAAVAHLWPSVVDGGVVDRGALAKIVFTDPESLAELEAITHPFIERRARDEIAASERPVAVEVPVMKVFEDDPFMRIAVVADIDVRVARAVTRGSTREDVMQRVARQPSEDEWRVWADVVIDNSGAWAHTQEAVDALVRRLISRG